MREIALLTSRIKGFILLLANFFLKSSSKYTANNNHSRLHKMDEPAILSDNVANMKYCNGVGAKSLYFHSIQQRITK